MKTFSAVLLLMFNIVVAAQYSEITNECINYHRYCFPDNVCTYSLITPRQDGLLCPPLQDTIVSLQDTEQALHQLQSDMAEQNNIVEQLQQQVETQQMKIEQLQFDSQQEKEIHQLQTEVLQHKATTTHTGCDCNCFYEPHQNLSTSYYSGDTETFQICNTDYVAMISGTCTIYQYMETGVFSEVQKITLESGISGVEYFEMNSQHYLAFAVTPDYFSRLAKQMLYKWTGSEFEEFQTICEESYEAEDWAFTTANTQSGTKHFLAVANYKTNAEDSNYEYDVNSAVYTWNGQSFIHFQDIFTHGALDVTFFTVNNDVYLCFGNGASGDLRAKSYNLPSEVYKLNSDGTSFDHHQTLPIKGESNAITSFHYNGNLFLMDGLRYASSFVADSPIYIWDETNQELVLHQTLQTTQPFMLCAFEMDGDMFLTVANFQDGSSPTVDSIVYKTNGMTFDEYQVLNTYGNRGYSCGSLQTDTEQFVFLNTVAYKYA